MYSHSLVPFLRRILKIPNSSKSPILVHCSAGVGRTGTVILCDICLRMASRSGTIDVLSNLELIRNQRPNMVDNPEQYKLVHLTILECLLGMSTIIPCNEDIRNAVETLIQNDGIESQMRYLEDTKWQDQCMKSVCHVKTPTPIYKDKNRFTNIIPENHARIILPCYPYDDEESAYINAVYVDGFRKYERFIVTQQPLPNTIGDFWRLVDERSVSVVISLNTIDERDNTSCEFWAENRTEMKPVDYISIHHKTTVNYGNYDIIKLELVHHGKQRKSVVEIISVTDWPAKNETPSNLETFLEFWNTSNSLSRKSQPVIVTCYDGVTASGLYIATSFLIDKMNLEQECDVCDAVRSIRHNRQEFIRSPIQYQFLLQTCVQYMSGFQSYANFN